MRELKLIDRAVIFATEHHAGQTRKGKTAPYIMHPLETMLILKTMDADEELLAAGVLHDTVEDTDATAEDLLEAFGPEVARLVAAHSEDKTKTWKERKTHAVEELRTAEKRVRMLVMADKVSNLRELYRDYTELGDRVFERFNAPVELQGWYYSAVQDALEEMQFEPECAQTYWEMVGLFKDIFVTFYLDDEKECIYQIGVNGEGYVLYRTRLEWQPYSGPIPKSAEELPRVQAENIETAWHDISLLDFDHRGIRMS